MELEALMNQINPHFLYNALQLIQTRAVLDENREIEDMVTSLGSMLHYTMNKSSEYVCLDEELAYIENYLAFYKARFHARFTYEILCSDEARACRTLKFILQPIVENCFTHGLRDKKAGGVLSVRVEEAGEALLLHVYDNGSGIAPDRLAALRAALASEAPGGASYGIGLLNTHARIRLVYGPGCGVGVTSIEGEYTEVSIRIPREVQQDV